MTYDAGDIVRVPFPFTDRALLKRRPALVLSKKHFNEQHKHLILAMVTSANNSSWPSDTRINDQTSAGLPSPSVVRLKLFTLDERLILDKLGKLSSKDRAAVTKNVNMSLGFRV